MEKKEKQEKQGKMKPLHENHRQRMREKVLQDGIHILANHELLEMLLYYCIPMRDTNELAHRIYDGFGQSLSLLVNAQTEDIIRRCDISEKTALLFALIREYMSRVAKENLQPRKPLDTPEAAGQYAMGLLLHETQECFYAICLDAQKRVIAPALIGRGEPSHVVINPRKVAEAIFRYHGNSVILTHNHPAKTIHPTLSDIELTNFLAAALNYMNIRVEDHIIIGGDQYCSMAELGMIRKQKLFCEEEQI